MSALEYSYVKHYKFFTIKKERSLYIGYVSLKMLYLDQLIVLNNVRKKNHVNKLFLTFSDDN